MTRTAVMVGIAIVVAVLPVGDVQADDDEYRFKWPYRPEGVHVTTGKPYQAHHSNADAWDFDVDGGGVNGEIVSSAEGTVTYATSEYDPDTCNPNDDFGFGNNVKVVVPLPDPQTDITMTYAHLSSASVAQGNRVLQGDQIGIEGKTGKTFGSEQPGWNYPEGWIGCGTHLHWEFAETPGRPDYIDGDYVGGSPPAGGPSTNSIVGAYNAPGAAIRQLYWDSGELESGPSWGVVGYTADWTSSQSGCGGTPFCRLYVHYAPDPLVGPWGSVQTFRQHPSVPIFNDNSIMVGRWAVNDAYRVEEPFFAAWLGGLQGVGLPLMDRVGPGAMCDVTECCFPVTGCEALPAVPRRLHLGARNPGHAGARHLPGRGAALSQPGLLRNGR